MIQNLTASSIFKPIKFKDSLLPWGSCLATTQKGEKYKKTKCKHQELADSKHCKEPRDLKMYQSTCVDAYIKIQDPCCIYARTVITQSLEL